MAKKVSAPHRTWSMPPKGEDNVWRVTITRRHPSCPYNVTERITITRHVGEEAHVSIEWLRCGRQQKNRSYNTGVTEVVIHPNDYDIIYPKKPGDVCRQFELLWLLWQAEVFNNVFDFWADVQEGFNRWATDATMSGLADELLRLRAQNFRGVAATNTPLNDLLEMAGDLPIDNADHGQLAAALEALQRAMIYDRG